MGMRPNSAPLSEIVSHLEGRSFLWSAKMSQKSQLHLKIHGFTDCNALRNLGSQGACPRLLIITSSSGGSTLDIIKVWDSLEFSF